MVGICLFPDLSFEQSLGLTVVATLACATWIWAVDRRTAPGRWRLAAAAPVVALNLLIPLLFCRWESCTVILLLSFNNSWIQNFKAICWALGRGALCMQHFTLPQFLVVYLAPITPAVSEAQSDDDTPASAAKARAAAKAAANGNSSGNGAAEGHPTGNSGSQAGGKLPRRGSQGRLGEDAGGSGNMVASFLGKHVFALVLIYLLQFDLPGLVESFVCGLALYALLSLIMDGPAALAIGSTGLRVSPHFDRPWRSTSVASFWSKRWDLAAGNTLRQLVYDSVVEGSLMVLPPGAQPPRPSAARQALGTLATFAASGVIHEAIFWYITGHTTGGIWFTFFSIQAPLIFAERLVLAALKRRGILLPAWLRTAVTALLVVGTGQHLFWGPAKQYGVTDCIVGNTRQAWMDILRSVGIPLPM